MSVFSVMKGLTNKEKRLVKESKDLLAKIEKVWNKDQETFNRKDVVMGRLREDSNLKFQSWVFKTKDRINKDKDKDIQIIKMMFNDKEWVQNRVHNSES